MPSNIIAAASRLLTVRSIPTVVRNICSFFRKATALRLYSLHDHCRLLDRHVDICGRISEYMNLTVYMTTLWSLYSQKLTDSEREYTCCVKTGSRLIIKTIDSEGLIKVLHQQCLWTLRTGRSAGNAKSDFLTRDMFPRMKIWSLQGVKSSASLWKRVIGIRWNSVKFIFVSEAL